MLTALTSLYGADQSIDSINGIEGITLGKLASFSGQINSSLILRATVTDKIEAVYENDGVIVLPLTAYDDPNSFGERFIKADEFTNMLTALSSLYGNNGSIEDVNGIETISIALVSDNIDSVVSSEILRATITSKLELTIDGSSKDVHVLETDIVRTKDLENNDIVVLNEAELRNVVNAINSISSSGSLSFEINLETLKKILTTPSILNSTIVRMAVSDYLVEGVEIAPGIVINYESTTGTTITSSTYVKVPEGNNVSKKALSKDEILEFIETYIP